MNNFVWRWLNNPDSCTISFLLILSGVSAQHRWVISMPSTWPVYLNLPAVLPRCSQQITIWKNKTLVITYWTILYKIFLLVLYFILLIFFWCLTNFSQRIFHTTWRNGSTYIHMYIPCIHTFLAGTAGCGTSHKYTNIHNFYSVKYYKHFTK